MMSVYKADILFSIFRSTVSGVLVSVNYFFDCPENFLIFTWGLFILTLVLLVWDIYDWRQVTKIEK